MPVIRIYVPVMAVQFYNYIAIDEIMRLQNMNIIEIKRSRKGFDNLYLRYKREREEYIESLFYILLRYYYIAAIVESRHIGKTSIGNKIKYPFGIYNDRYEFLGGIPTTWDIPLLEDVYTFFTKFRWSSAFGGKSWGEIAKHVLWGMKLMNEDIGMKIVWTDQAFSLEHNNGNALNKYDIFSSLFGKGFVVNGHLPNTDSHITKVLNMKFESSPKNLLSSPIFSYNGTRTQMRMARALGVKTFYTGKPYKKYYREVADEIEEIPYGNINRIIVKNGTFLQSFNRIPVYGDFYIITE